MNSIASPFTNPHFEAGRELAYNNMAQADLYHVGTRTFWRHLEEGDRPWAWHNVGSMALLIPRDPDDILYEYKLKGSIDAVTEFTIAAALFPDDRPLIDAQYEPGSPPYRWKGNLIPLSDIMPDRFPVKEGARADG